MDIRLPPTLEGAAKLHYPVWAVFTDSILPLYKGIKSYTQTGKGLDHVLRVTRPQVQTPAQIGLLNTAR